VIEQVETKYGFRRSQPAAEVTGVAAGTAVDSEMIKEIESYYQQKRLRDLQRKRQGQSGPGVAKGERTGLMVPASSPRQESGKEPDE
jgi:hypothetical protein